MLRMQASLVHILVVIVRLELLSTYFSASLISATIKSELEIFDLGYGKFLTASKEVVSITEKR